MFKNIYGDENRINQILLNFLSNAFKLTPKNGNIEVELKVTKDRIVNQKENKNSKEEKVSSLNESEESKDNQICLSDDMVKLDSFSNDKALAYVGSTSL